MSTYKRGARMENTNDIQKSLANKYFSRKTIDEIISSKARVKNEWEDLYIYLNKNYRNEYYYKNTLFNKFVIGKYSPRTSYATGEVIINRSRADFLLVNNNDAFIFEIKTELDTLDKLIYQVEDYYKVCSIVYILVSEDKYYPAYKLLKDYKVGICVLTKTNTISIRKLPEEDNSRLSHEALFKLLRKDEYEYLIEQEFKKIPNLKEVHKFKEYMKKFKLLDIKKCQIIVFKQLNRRKKGVDVEYIKRVPFELRWLVYQANLNRKNYERLLENILGGK